MTMDAHLAELAPAPDGPVLLVHGSATTDSLKRVVAVLNERLPDSSVIELPGNHARHLEYPEALLAPLERHMTQ
jgi:pimeloyl-ACP methyl ester carboxylesterase